MASQNIARLGVVLGIDTAEFQAGVDKAIAENKKLKASIQRETNAAAKEIIALKYATEDYGKSVTKVTQVQREIAAGKYANATDQMKKLLLDQAAAYDTVVAAQSKTQQSTIKTFQINQQQLAALGYQTTDIVTGLVSGQNPLLVLIQQGGQLRDQFGGFGNLMRGIASQITMARLAFVGIAGAVGTLVMAFYKGSQEFKEFQNNLTLTNNIAGVTYDQVRNVAKVLASDFNTTVGEARDILNALVGSGKFTSESMYSVSEAIARVSKLTGQAADQVAKDLIPSFDGSVSSAKRLNEQYNFLTLEQYKQIELLSMQGQTQKAAALTADLLTESLSKQNRQVGFLEKGYNALKQSFSSFWDGLKQLGADESVEQKLNSIAQTIRDTEAAMATSKSAGTKARYQKDIDELVKRAADLSLQFGQENAKRIVEAEKIAREKAGIEKYAAAGGESKERSLKAEIEKNQIKASIEEFRRGVDERARIELDAQEQMLLVISEMKKRNIQENNVFQSQNEVLMQQELMRIYADMEEKKAEISRQAAKEVRERQATEQASINAEREKLEIYTQNIFATQTELDIALSRLAVEKEIARIMRDTRLSPEEREAAIERQRQIGANREEVAKLGEQLGRLKEINQSVWQNMSNAIEQFVRTGKFSFKELAKSIIFDLMTIELKAQATQIFKGLGGGLKNLLNGGVNPMGYEAPDFIGFADGGEPPVGVPSIVGERGPELFIPRTAGTIVPNNKLADTLGGPQTVYNGPYIANMQAIDTQSATQFLAKNKMAVWSANQSATRSIPANRV